MDSEKIIENMKAVLKSTKKKKIEKNKEGAKSCSSTKSHNSDIDSVKEDDEVISELMTRNWQMKSPLKGDTSIEKLQKLNAFERMMSKQKQNEKYLPDSNHTNHVKIKGKRGRKKKEADKNESLSDLFINESNDCSTKIELANETKIKSPSLNNSLFKLFRNDSTSPSLSAQKLIDNKNDNVEVKIKIKGKRGRKKKQVIIERLEFESDLSVLDEESFKKTSPSSVATAGAKIKSPHHNNGILKFLNISPAQIANAKDIDMGKKRVRDVDEDNDIDDDKIISSLTVDSAKKKRKIKESKVLLDSNKNPITRNLAVDIVAENNDDGNDDDEGDDYERADVKQTEFGRPKRSCAMKINYSLLIDSPEKELIEMQRKKLNRAKSKHSDDNDEVFEVDENSPVKQKKPVKLAPVFVKKIPKPSIDPEILEARRNFLLSELPAHLKAPIEKQKQYEDEILSNYLIAYPLVSHVLQSKALNIVSDENINESRIKINFHNDDTDDDDYDVIESKASCALKCGKLTDCRWENGFHNNDDNNPVLIVSNTNNNDTDVWKQRLLSANDIKLVVREIKESCKNFPVNRCFKQILSKQKMARNNDADGTSQFNSQYIDIFKPMNSEEFLIGTKPIKTLKEFLTTWNDKNNRYEAYDSYDDDDESNSRQSFKGLNNYVVLSGNCGVGKTMSVYALANELNYEVIEINAGTRRSGKKILQDLLEATQSHRVEKKRFTNDDDSNSEYNSQNDGGLVNSKKSIILIEDAELTFENDDGFISSIQQLINISKRPVILTTNDRNCLHLQKFIQHNEIIYENPQEYVVKYLSLLCLATCNYQIDEVDIEKLYTLNKRDLRKTINEIEFFTRSDTAKVNGGNLIDIFHSHTHKKKQEIISKGQLPKSRRDLTKVCLESSMLSDFSTLQTCAHRLKENTDSSYQHNLLNEMTEYFELCNVDLQHNFVSDKGER
jgi:hypothetical protein